MTTKTMITTTTALKHRKNLCQNCTKLKMVLNEPKIVQKRSHNNPKIVRNWSEDDQSGRMESGFYFFPTGDNEHPNETNARERDRNFLGLCGWQNRCKIAETKRLWLCSCDPSDRGSKAVRSGPDLWSGSVLALILIFLIRSFSDLGTDLDCFDLIFGLLKTRPVWSWSGPVSDPIFFWYEDRQNIEISIIWDTHGNLRLPY